MFHWICPECGREIAPTVRECPVCDPNAATAEPVQAGVVEAPARALSVEVTEKAKEPTIVTSPVSKVPVPTKLEVDRRQVAPTETINLPPGGLTALLEEHERAKAAPPQVAELLPHVEVVQPASPQPQQRAKRQDSGRYWLKLSKEGHVNWDPLARLEAFARRRGQEPRVESVPLAPPPVPSLPEPQTLTPDTLETVALPEYLDPVLPSLGSADITGNPLDDLVSAMGMAEEEETAPPQATEILSVPGPRVAIPPAFRALISELSPARFPKAEIRPAVPAASGIAERQSHELPMVQSRVESSGGRLPHLASQRPSNQFQNALQSWTEDTSIRKPVEPRIPHSIPSPEMAGWVKYSPLASRPILPEPPRDEIRARDCQPRVTLPGPALIKKLVAFHDKELQPVFFQRSAPKKGGIPRWMVTALILGTLLGAGFSSFFTFIPASAPAEAKTTNAVPKATEPVEAAASGSAPTESAAATPLSRAIEVTGFRIQADSNKKAEIDYVVVNHSATKLSGMTVFVTLHSTEAKAGEPPLCRFSFAAPDLKPMDAKAMVSTIERFNRPVAIPDWQNIRAEIEIGQ